MNGRVYDPLLGRFLSPDNIIQAPGNSQSYNRYSYCLNNPFVYTDPSGYSLFSRFGNWLKESFDNLGAWMSKNDITIGVGYNTTLSNPGGGTPYAGGSVDGTNISIGYNLDSGQVGIGTNNGGAVTNFYYPAEDYGKSEQTAINNIEIVRAVYTNDYWLGRSQSAASRLGSVKLNGGTNENVNYPGGPYTSWAGIIGQAAELGSKEVRIPGAPVKFVGKWATKVGWTGEAISNIVNIYNVSRNPTWGNYGRLTIGLGITATNFIPYAGPMISFGLSAYDAGGGFNDLYNALDMDQTLYKSTGTIIVPPVLPEVSVPMLINLNR